LQWQPSEIRIRVDSKFVTEHKARNVAAYLPGTSNADSFIVFTAHYDHLGRMGPKALFAGANDNASGTAMIIDLARWFAKPENRPAKSVLFIAFAGEEAGLIGSKYYTESPMVRLDRIRFLLNLDLMGNGDEGMMVVNGELHSKEFDMLDRINKEKGYLKTLGKRGTAKNSDHYFFSEKGVPAFFFYTNGGSKAYHDVNDLPYQLPLTEFEDIKKLIVDFVGEVGK
jgi:Zn-dependent M28 family amino/carboxypeptidase